MGACDQNQVEEILDFFYAQGGNFIDTANNYQFEESEQWIGEWMKKRDNRDQMGEYSSKYVNATGKTGKTNTTFQLLPPSTRHASVLDMEKLAPTSPETVPRACIPLSMPV